MPPEACVVVEDSGDLDVEIDRDDADLAAGKPDQHSRDLYGCDAEVPLCEVEGAAYLPMGMSRPPGTDTGALAYAAVTLVATHAEIAAIACYTRTGRTARILASLRPQVPIIAFSPDADVAARLALVNAVVPRLCDPLGESDRIGQLLRLLSESQLVSDGVVVLVSSTTTPGSAPNLLSLQQIPVGAGPADR